MKKKYYSDNNRLFYSLRTLFPLLLALLFLAAACKKDDDSDDNNNNNTTDVNSVKAVLNGGGFNNAFVTFNNFVEGQTFAGWVPGNNISRIEAWAQWSAQTAQFKLYFPDTIPNSFSYSEPQPPDFSMPDSLYFLLEVKDTPLGDIAVKQVNFTISEYGPIGGRIKGTFSGQFYTYDDNGTEQIVTATNGQFNLERSY